MIYNSIKNNDEDHQIPILIDDTVQCLKFFPSNDLNILASGGWDSKLRIFEIKYDIISTALNNDNVKISSNQVNICQNPSPILSLSWKSNTGCLFTGCADGSINYIDCQKNVINKFGEHKYGCREVIHLDNYNLLLSGGWDGAIKLWDIRSSNNPISTYQFNNKIYTMSHSKNLLVVGLSENIISYFNLNNLQYSKFEPELIYSSHINSQIKKVAVLRDGNGYAEGASMGRVSIKYIELYKPIPIFDKEKNEIKNEKDFSFKCHREKRNNIIYIHNINDICVNPFYGSICTVGGDGKYAIWDLEKRQRICERKNFKDKTPLTACEYNKKGNLLVYASGYDWSKGAKDAHLYSKPKIFVHYLQQNQRKLI